MEIYIQDDDRRIKLDVPEEHFVELIEEDQRLRSIEAGEPASPREPQEILDERFNNPDSNAHHNYWLQDRKGVRFFSLEVWNEYGNQADASSHSAEAELIQVIQAAEKRGRRRRLKRSSLSSLSPYPRHNGKFSPRGITRAWLLLISLWIVVYLRL